MLSLLIRNLVFTVVVPGLGGAWVPAWLLTRDGGTAVPVAWEAVPVIAAGAVLFGSLRLLAYAGVLAACFHLFVTGYEEPALRRRFGPAYLAYRDAVPRWIPDLYRPPYEGGSL